MFSEGAGEAMEYYTTIFKNSRIVSTLPGPDGKVMGGTLEIDGDQILTYNGGDYFSFSQGISLFVMADTQEEIDYFWEKLSEGGQQVECGWLKDKFGLSWQVTPRNWAELLQGDIQKTDRVMKAVMQMKKLNIAEMEKAAKG